MMIGYKKPGTALLTGKAMLDMKKMAAELHEHRHYLERNVERRTEHLLKRIAVLESCNAALCDKLAQAHAALAAPKPAERGMKLYVMNNQAPKLIELNSQDQWGEHATAA